MGEVVTFLMCLNGKECLMKYEEQKCNKQML
jgi:hypothetical protein